MTNSILRKMYPGDWSTFSESGWDVINKKFKELFDDVAISEDEVTKIRLIGN